MSSTCTICSRPAVRSVVDSALATGERPASIYRSYAESGDLFSLSALYRHARSHRPAPSLTPQYLGEQSSGDVVADLAAVARSAYAQHHLAIDAGQAASAARWAHEAVTAFSALQRAGVMNEDEANAASERDGLRNVLSRILFVRRDVMADAEQVARRLGLGNLADDIAGPLREAFETYDAQQGKKEIQHV